MSSSKSPDSRSRRHHHGPPLARCAAIAVAVFASSVPPAVYAATVGARLRQLGAAVPAATIALPVESWQLGRWA